MEKSSSMQWHFVWVRISKSFRIILPLKAHKRTNCINILYLIFTSFPHDDSNSPPFPPWKHNRENTELLQLQRNTILGKVKSGYAMLQYSPFRKCMTLLKLVSISAHFLNIFTGERLGSILHCKRKKWVSNFIPYDLPVIECHTYIVPCF